LLASIFGCQKSPDPVLTDPGFGYYPLLLGSERIYMVERIDYYLGIDTASNEVITMADSQEYFIREQIVSSQDGIDGSEIFLEHSYSIPDTSFNWPFQPDSIYQVQNNEVYLNKNRNNRTTTELRFPLQKSASWDGNAFNSSQKEIFVVDSFEFRLELNGMLFEKCIRVIKSDIENLIEKDIRYEIYADQIGSVFKSFAVILYKQNIPGSLEGLQRIERGFEEKWYFYEME
jgi:hypothetical protein